MAKINPVRQQIITISRDYLGPASERFIDRQVETHLKKPVDEITRNDIVKLVEWIRLAFALLTNDSREVEEYVNRLLEVAKNKKATLSYNR